MSKKKKILIPLCSLALAGVVGVGVLKFNEIKSFATSLFSPSSSVSQTITPPVDTEVKPDEKLPEVNLPEVNPYENCGAYTVSGEEVKTWQALLDEGFIEVKENGISATEEFSSLSYVVLKVPAIYTEIAPAGFKGCKNLVGIELPEGITTLHYECFHDCINLENISYPESAIHVAGLVFLGCTKLNYYEYEDCRYLGNDNNNFVFLSDLGNSYTEIESFENFNEGCRVVGSGVFAKNTSYKKVFDGDFPYSKLVFPNHIKAIGSNVIDYTLPRYVYIPETVESVAYADEESGSPSFGIANGYPCHIYIGGPRTVISNYVFRDFTPIYNASLEKFKLSSNFNYSSESFVPEVNGMYCENNGKTWQELLDNNYLSVDENGVLTNPENKYMTGLLKIPEGVTEISDNCFRNYSLRFDLPNSLTKIGDYAFAYTTFLKFDSKNITYIGNGAFKNNYRMAMEPFILREGLEYIGENAFEGYSSTEMNLLVIPNSVKYIGANAFSSCRKIKNYVLTQGITSLDMNIFPDREINSIYIPSTVTEIIFGDYFKGEYFSNNITFYFESSSCPTTEDISSISTQIKYGYTYEQYFAEINIPVVS